MVVTVPTTAAAGVGVWGGKWGEAGEEKELFALRVREAHRVGIFVVFWPLFSEDRSRALDGLTAMNTVFSPQFWYIGEEVRVDELFAPSCRAHESPPKLSSICSPLEAHTPTAHSWPLSCLTVARPLPEHLLPGPDHLVCMCSPTPPRLPSRPVGAQPQ